MKKLLLLIFLVGGTSVYAQSGTTYKITKLQVTKIVDGKPGTPDPEKEVSGEIYFSPEEGVMNVAYSGWSDSYELSGEDVEKTDEGWKKTEVYDAYDEYGGEYIVTIETIMGGKSIIITEESRMVRYTLQTM